MSITSTPGSVPAISVLMPCYNAERFLPEAIQSILDQTFGDFEFVIVDDGSTDNTLNVLRMFAERDHRIRVIENDHGGISSALNRGVAECRGEWIARMDGDDIALPDRLEKQVKAARENPRVVVWGAYAYHINRDGRTLGISRTGPTSEQHFREMRSSGGEVHVIHPTAMLHRQTLLGAGGYDAKYNGCEDFELFDRMSECGPVVAITEPLLRYRIHSSSVSMKKFFTMRRLASYVIERHKQRLKGETLTLERYLDQQSHQPPTAKLAWWIFHTSGFYYRKAGLCYGERKLVRASGNFAMAALLNPRYSLWRVWNQLFSKRARQLLKQTPAQEPAVVI